MRNIKIRLKIETIAVALLLTGCNTTKFVPEGEYLLDKVNINIDTRNVKKIELKEYLRQTPNSSVFGLFRTQLGIYSLAGKDTSKWINKTLMRIGEEPVIYNPALTEISSQQLQLFMHNKGFLRAKVENKVTLKDKKAEVEYQILAHQPYRIRNYSVQLNHPELQAIAADTSRSLIRPGMLFDVDMLDAERERITSRFRQTGYYNFSKDFIVYSADSIEKTHQVDLSMQLRDYLNDKNDSLSQIIFRKFYVRNVYFEINPTDLPSLNQPMEKDTVWFRNFAMITPHKQIIKIDALVQNTYIDPQALFNDANIEKTYSGLNSLGAIKFVNIGFEQVDTGLLDCHISIIPGKAISLSAEVEATYTDGYWGGATNLNLVNRNIFKGAETLSLQVHGAYELQEKVWAQEWGGQIGLQFPRVVLPFASYDFKRNLRANTEFSGSYYYQFRPGEFRTSNLGAGMRYFLNRRQYTHIFDLFEVNYVYFPEIFPAFRDSFLTTGIFNSYNYENHFIMRMGYSGSSTNFNANQPLRNYRTMRYSIETAGNILYGLDHLLGSRPAEDGNYRLLNIAYAQYFKTEYNLTYHQIFDENNRFVYHAGLGIAIPYGNADAVPYEKRFFSGGANGVRGWSESTLGPGVYKRINTQRRDFNQTGDIKLDMNMEYRGKLFWLLESAVFMDAGNIWTIKDYDTQQGGLFKWNSFMNQIAVAYGVGLRFDFSFIVARLDMGVKLYDPVLKRSDRWRVSPQWNDVAFHIAIGYPF